MESTTREDDLALLRDVESGDPAAERTLVVRISGRGTRTCRYLAGDGDAPDLAQLAVLQVVQSAGSFRGECSLEYWVDRVTVRTAAKQFEKRSRRRQLREAHADPDPMVVDVEHQAALGQVRERLAFQFSRLSERQRGAVVLHYLYGYEISEIADLLGARINAVRSRLRKGLTQLRRYILADSCLREWVREGQR